MKKCTILIILAILLASPLLFGAGVGKRKLPKGYTLSEAKRKRYILKDATIHVYSKGFRQGDICYLEFLCDNPDDFLDLTVSYISTISGKSERYDMYFSTHEWGYRSFFPIHAETRSGKQRLVIDYFHGDEFIHESVQFTIVDRKFKVSEVPLNISGYNGASRLSEETKAYIKECSEKKKIAFESASADLFTASLSHPRGMHYITSQFWAKRKYTRYKTVNGKKVRQKNTVSIHRGIDLRGKRGTPVYAMARGKVVLASKLYYEGNMVILDHGNHIFTYYMHLHSLDVEKGDIVFPGSTIATVGSTGRSTAPHLHVSLKCDGIQVDPLSLLPLPVRD